MQEIAGSPDFYDKFIGAEKRAKFEATLIIPSIKASLSLKPEKMEACVDEAKYIGDEENFWSDPDAAAQLVTI
jgi:hypothetical protein